MLSINKIELTNQYPIMVLKTHINHKTMLPIIVAYLIIFILFVSFRISISELLVVFELLWQPTIIWLEPPSQVNNTILYQKDNIYKV